MNCWQHVMVWMGIVAITCLQTSYHANHETFGVVCLSLGLVTLLIGLVAFFMGWPEKEGP